MSHIPASPPRFRRPLGSTLASSRSLRCPHSLGKIPLAPLRAVLTPGGHKQNGIQSHRDDISMVFPVKETGNVVLLREISGD